MRVKHLKREDGPEVGKKVAQQGPPREGIVAVEFCIVAVFLVFLILGMVEISRGMMVKQTLSNAARFGCRLGCEGNGNNKTIEAEVRTILNDNKLSGKDAIIKVQVEGVTSDAASAIRGNKVAVTVTLPVSTFHWGSGIFYQKTNNASETIIMMKQSG